MSFTVSFGIPRPRRFLFMLSLPTANTLLVYVFLLNKASAFYGLLSPLTGAPMSVLQASMYLYSVIALTAVLFYIGPRIRLPGNSAVLPDPLCLLLWAYLYLFDTVVNALYTAAFAFLWFLHIALEEATRDSNGDAVPDTPLDFNKALFQNGSVASLILVISLWVVRFYSVFVIFAYCRLVLRHYIAMNATPTSAGPDLASHMVDDPFREGTDAGEGWRGQLGRRLISVCQAYWLAVDPPSAGSANDIELGLAATWLNGLSRKLTAPNGHTPTTPVPNVSERERRRRSGTGPPNPVGLGRMSTERIPLTTTTHHIQTSLDDEQAV